MNKQTKNLLLIGVAAYVVYLTMQRRQTGPTPQYPQPYTRGTPEWISWAQGVISAAGGLANELFGPGGPFEGKSKEEVSDIVYGEPVY